MYKRTRFFYTEVYLFSSCVRSSFPAYVTTCSYLDISNTLKCVSSAFLSHQHFAHRSDPHCLLKIHSIFPCTRPNFWVVKVVGLEHIHLFFWVKLEPIQQMIHVPAVKVFLARPQSCTTSTAGSVNKHTVMVTTHPPHRYIVTCMPPAKGCCILQMKPACFSNDVGKIRKHRSCDPFPRCKQSFLLECYPFFTFYTSSSVQFHHFM